MGPKKFSSAVSAQSSRISVPIHNCQRNMNPSLHRPKTKKQSKQWRSGSKKVKTVPSASKIMATIFWDVHGIIFIDYLEKGRTITGEYCASLLDQLNNKTNQKRPHLAKKKVLFHQDSEPATKGAIGMEKLHKLGYQMLHHPPYSPDLSSFGLLPVSEHE